MWWFSPSLKCIFGQKDWRTECMDHVWTLFSFSLLITAGMTSFVVCKTTLSYIRWASCPRGVWRFTLYAKIKYAKKQDWHPLLLLSFLIELPIFQRSTQLSIIRILLLRLTHSKTRISGSRQFNSLSSPDEYTTSETDTLTVHVTCKIPGICLGWDFVLSNSCIGRPPHPTPPPSEQLLRVISILEYVKCPRKMIHHLVKFLQIIRSPFGAHFQ